ncbi:MAG: hypothetical protein WAX89_03735 [Alphaproteobacteria bacterium]
MSNDLILPGDFGFGDATVFEQAVAAVQASELTIIGMTTDLSGSVSGWVSELRQMKLGIVEACQMSPHKYNLIMRATGFSDKLIREFHPFKPLMEVDPAVDYPMPLPIGGMTNLFDACVEGLNALGAMGATAFNAEKFSASNAAFFATTDGYNNSSSHKAKDVAAVIKRIKHGEIFSELTTTLIGINSEFDPHASKAEQARQTAAFKQYLEGIRQEMGFDAVLMTEDASPKSLAKLGGWISKSISTVSQNRQSGGASAAVAASAKATF